MFTSPAFAQGVGSAGSGDFMIQLMPILLMIVIFYFLLFRPQQQRMKEHKAKLGALRRGDTVITSGGIIGKVTKLVNEGEVEVEIAADTKVRVIRSTISDVINKNEPVKDNA